jgi:two-component system phosphate regulon sensor histidine kinase PhoR
VNIHGNGLKVLVVDDEEDISDLIKFHLEEEGFQVFVCQNGLEVLPRVDLSLPDLIILDIMLPGIGGIDLCKRIKEKFKVPIIMVTAKTGETDAVLGLELGADDYVRKPFSPRELMARVRSVLRRYEEKTEEGKEGNITIGKIHLNKKAHKVFVDSKEVDVTLIEYIILLTTGLILYFVETQVATEFKFVLFVLYIIFSMLIAFHTSFRIATSVTEHLIVIEKKTMEINAGDFGTLLAASDIQELSDLASSINSMSRRLQMQFTDLNVEKEKFNSLLQNLREGVFAISLDKKILFQNQSIPETLMPANSQSRSIDDVIINKKLLGFLNDHIESSMDGKIGIDDSKHYYRVWFYSLKSNNQILMYIGVVSDKTDERETQMLREQFVQNASHELKTPITSIKGYAETLESKLRLSPDSVEKKFIQAILRNTDRMIRIVEDMLTISKLESQNSFFQPEKVNLYELVQNLKFTVDGFIKIKNQTFTADVPANIYLYADMILLEHLFLNLIQNASTYSSENQSIHLFAQCKDNTVIIQVVDQGIGISESHLDRIFERFYRVDTDRSRKGGGTGLGLSIVKHIVKLHSGWINVSSSQGEGTTFTINLPIDRKKAVS